ncbi:MAG: sensor histidine kinase [Bacteroidales bacterium]
MNYLTFRNIRTVLIHLLFWVAVWFLYYYFFSYNSDDRGSVVWFSTLLVPLTASVTYFSVYFLIPGYLLLKRYGRFFLYLFYLLVFSSYVIVLIIYGSLLILRDFDASSIPPMIKNFMFILVLVYMVVGIVSTVSILNHNFKTDARNRDLQNRILAAQLQVKEQELQYLKMQIHPHFLFNTLNTVYGLALKGSHDTPDVIIKLSNLLDYILYQVSKPRVPLSDEVNHIREYVDLEQIRFRDSLKVGFIAETEGENLEIAPMLLLPFVENAFKHGSPHDGFLMVDISIIVKEGVLNFHIRNSITGKQSANRRGTPGIGLQNIGKRLDMNYAGSYQLESGADDKWYTVNLILDILNIQQNESNS